MIKEIYNVACMYCLCLIENELTELGHRCEDSVDSGPPVYIEMLNSRFVITQTTYTLTSCLTAATNTQQTCSTNTNSRREFSALHTWWCSG